MTNTLYLLVWWESRPLVLELLEVVEGGDGFEDAEDGLMELFFRRRNRRRELFVEEALKKRDSNSDIDKFSKYFSI